MRDPSELRDQLSLRPLPNEVIALLSGFDVPPRLIAHLILVHDVAVQLVTILYRYWPNLLLDSSAILLGAAWHDIGKLIIPQELTDPGHRHEKAGETFLVKAGIAPDLARYAKTHATWDSEPDITIEDLVVALADACWKGKRDQALEQKIIDLIAGLTGSQRWDVLIKLDTEIETLADKANQRLAWQARFPVAVNS